MVAVKLGLGAFLRCEGSGDGTLHVLCTLVRREGRLR